MCELVFQIHCTPNKTGSSTTLSVLLNIWKHTIKELKSKQKIVSYNIRNTARHPKVHHKGAKIEAENQISSTTHQHIVLASLKNYFHHPSMPKSSKLYATTSSRPNLFDSRASESNIGKAAIPAVQISLFPPILITCKSLNSNPQYCYRYHSHKIMGINCKQAKRTLTTD